MSPIRLAAAALNQTPMAWASNREHILAAIGAARDAGAAVLCLPECCISGYGCEDAFFAKGVGETSLELLSEIVPETHGMAVALGLPLRWKGAILNAAALACDGRLIGFACKQHLASYGIHYETRWFQPWIPGEVDKILVAQRQYPMGDLLFDCGGVRIGFEICHDAWTEDRPGRRLAAAGAQILLNPSASHFAFGKEATRRELVLDGSRNFQASYVYANLLGNESGRAIYDGGTLIAHGGKLLASGPLFSYADYQLTTADVTLPRASDARADDRGATAASDLHSVATVECHFHLPHPRRKPSPQAISAHASMPGDASFSKTEEFARAVPLALLDYLRKTGARCFVVSLSGGADSSAVAALVWLIVRLGVNELGLRGLLQRLFPLDEPAEEMSETDLVRRLLTCVYQSTCNSSDVTRSAAKRLAEAIGAEFLQWDVEQMVRAYIDTVSGTLGRQLDWDHDDLALQNIQARARGPSVWLLANLRHALLLATSNRSEAAVGYATMDGDTCGGLSPIAGIDKAFLIEWLRWMERTGPEGIGPLPALAAVNAQQPTAELRPPSAGQTDEEDLMPYQVLDRIERAAIRDKQMPIEVLETITPGLADYSRPQLARWIERFFTLWCRNQWKRERYAPSFHLDDENLDPKTWCRFPILSGGYERELETLRRLS